MKKILSSLLAFNILTGVFSQRVGINTNMPLQTLDVRGNVYFSANLGIGTTNPLAKLHVVDSSVIFSSANPPDYLSHNLLVNGPGRRMFWYSERAAFRTGYVDGTQWDNDSIGVYSFASGLNTKALYIGSTAMGDNTKASGYDATALGGSSVASGGVATAIGGGTQAIGDYSTAMGLQTKATGYISTAIGYKSIAQGAYSISAGYLTTAKAMGSCSIGVSNENTDNPNPYFADASDRLFQIGNGSHNNAMTVLRNGNVGIGTDTYNPGFPLTFPNQHGDKISLWGNSGSHYGIGIQSNLLQIHTDDVISDIVFGVGSSGSFTENMRIKGNGNVGIGIASPAKKLHVGSGTVRIEGPAAPGGTALSLGGFGDLQVDAYGTAGGRFIVKENGNVGIGNATPGFPLNFASSLGDKVALWGNSGAHYGIGIQSNQLQIHTDISMSDIVFGFGSSASLTETMRIKGNGFVGIGTPAPSQKLQVIGNICASGTVGSCSDIRYKQNFSPIAHSLTSLLSLQGLYYYWKKNEFPAMQFTDKRQLGFSAQEVERSFPEVVMTDANGYKSVDYGRLTPVLVEAIKEQQQQIDELKKQNQLQQNQIDELKKDRQRPRRRSMN